MSAQRLSADGNGRRPDARNNGRARANGHAAIDLGVLNSHSGYFIRRMQVWIFQDFIRTLANVNIRPAQYSVLVVIDANPGLSQSDIAALLDIERARLVHLLDRLEERGLVQRLRSRADRRSHALVLTREGRKRLKQIKSLAARHEARVADRLGADNHRLLIEILKDFGNPQRAAR
jgi:DNA-binding MarR family transcriptional regulator